MITPRRLPSPAPSPAGAAVLLALTLVLLLACGGSDEKAAAGAGGDQVGEAIREEVEARTGAEATSGAAPCEVLSDAFLARYFDLAGAEVKRSPSEYSPQPLCTASWPKPNAAEIEAERDAQMADYLGRKMRGEEVERPNMRPNNEVSLTLPAKRFDGRDAAVAAFDSSMRILSEGMTVTVGGEEHESPTYESEPVSDVGVKAAWVPKLHQLSVVTEDRIFHVGVRIDGGPEAELAKAKELARDLADEL